MWRNFRIFLAMPLLLCAAFLKACVADEEPPRGSLGVGDALPYFAVTLNNGETLSTPDLIGKTSAIVFFNTACPDCRQELPVVQQLWQIVENDPQVCVVAISREEDAASVARYWRENSLSIPWSAQTDRIVYNLFAESVIPRIYIADPEGIITFSAGDSDMPSLEDLLSAIGN